MAIVLLSAALAQAETTEPQPTEKKTEVNKPKPTCIAIVGTNDLHGAVQPQTLEVGEQNVLRGGILTISGYVDILRQEFGKRVILLDAGDFLHGTLTANVSKGGVMIKAANAIGYTAATIGNHEFDFGPLLPGDPDKLGVIKKRIQEATFPFLAANITEKASGTPITWHNTLPSTMVNVEGIQVGIIGLASPSTPLTTRPQNVAELQFLNPQPVLIREASRLRENGAQLIIVVSHMGDKCPDTQNPNDLSSCNGRGELFSLLESMPKNLIDVAVGGHTHSVIAHWIGSTATIEAAYRGKKFTWVEACLGADGQMDRETTSIHPPVDTCLTTWADGQCGFRESPTETIPATYRGKTVQIHAKVKAAVQPFIDEVSLTRNAIIGSTLPKPFLRTPKQGLSLGDAVAEAMRRSIQADVGIQNRGGVRADLPAGALVYGNAYHVLPFGNQVTSMELTGAQLHAVVAHITKRHLGHPPHIAGLLVSNEDDDLRLMHMSGTAIERSRTYRVATNDFLATGGMGLGRILQHIPQTAISIEPVLLLDAFIEFLKKEFPTPVVEVPHTPDAIPAGRVSPSPESSSENP